MRGIVSSGLISIGLFIGIMLAIPFIMSNEYYIGVLVLAMLHAIIAVGLNLLMGYAGQISLGHAGFYGLAAYTTSVLSTTYNWPQPLSMVTAIVLVAIAAYFISIPILKLRGHYLAMGTLGLGIILYIVFNETVDITGGPNGFVGVPRLTLAGYEFASDYSYYYLMIGVLSIVLYIAINLINSRIGRALRALHTSEKAAQAVGVNIARYKVFVFTVSAVFAAIAGVFYAHYLQFIAPSSFGFIFSVELVAMVVLGGMASVWGAVIGAVFLTILPELLRDFHEIELALYGAILIATMMFMPRGIVGGASDLFKLVFKRKTSVEATEE